MKTKSNISAYIIRSALWAGFLSFAFIAVGLAVNSPNGWHKPAQATAVYNKATNIPVQPIVLTFVERVSYQRAIEEVYWRHRIWPRSGENADTKPSLNAVMSQAQLESKVTDYLRNSQTLQDGQQPITANELQAEMDRMAQHTRQPEVLRELFETLGNDPFVIAECLARPVLAERLLTQSANEQVKRTSETYEQVVTASEIYRLPSISDSGGCTDDTWTATTRTNAPGGRDGHTAVWTGSEMIVWGGADLHGYLNTGGRYNPATDSWTATSLTNAPTARDGHTAVWTGSEMIVWGMEIRRRKNQIEISELDPFLAELLRQIPASANTQGAPAAEQRIFSPPINGNEAESCAEWKMYVEPELRRLFQTATQTVGADLEQLNGNEKSLVNRTLRIPTKHADAWLSALNQARLVIAAKNNFTELELNDHLRSPIGSRRDLSLFQVNFYGFLQEFILREMDC